MTDVTSERPVASPEDLNEVFLSCRGEMVGLARKLLVQYRVPQCDADPEDVVQDAFLKALTVTTPITSHRAYVYQVIRNEVTHQARQRALRYRSQASIHADQARRHAASTMDISDLVANRSAITQYLGQLPQQQRTAVWLTKAMDLTYVETAEEMGNSRGTVSTHVSRATAFLKTHLGSAACAVLIGILTAVLVRGLRRWHQPAAKPPHQDPPRIAHWGLIETAALGGLGVVLLTAGIWAGMRYRGWDRHTPGNWWRQLRPLVGRLSTWATSVFTGMETRVRTLHAQRVARVDSRRRKAKQRVKPAKSSGTFVRAAESLLDQWGK